MSDSPIQIHYLNLLLYVKESLLEEDGNQKISMFWSPGFTHTPVKLLNKVS